MKLEFAYDYLGRRIFKKVYSGEILEKHLSFVYDGYKLIEERNALDNNAAVRKYVWQPEALDRDVPLTVYDAASEKTYYYHTDANKNVTEFSDESGNVVAHYEYSPFGSLTKATGDYAGSNPFRFSSEYFDEETGLVYYNYRYYNPELGRWISRDPIEEQGGENLYINSRNNLIINYDKLGLKSCWQEPEEIICKNLGKIMKKICEKYIQLLMKNQIARVAKCKFAKANCEWNCKMDDCMNDQQKEKCVADCQYNYAKCLCSN